tara:strand:+ start:445 stop:867 length:423 start_codon:yes stop_codon:yes gene_type:complete
VPFLENLERDPKLALSLLNQDGLPKVINNTEMANLLRGLYTEDPGLAEDVVEKYDFIFSRVKEAERGINLCLSWNGADEALDYFKGLPEGVKRSLPFTEAFAKLYHELCISTPYPNGRSYAANTMDLERYHPAWNRKSSD